MKLPTYSVWIDGPDGEPVEHQLAIRNGDRLRAELEAPRHIPASLSAKASGFHLMTLWCWAAAVREGVFEGKFVEFAAACPLIEPPDKDDPEGVADVPPTQPDPATVKP
jgi:hypothetical protein